MALYYEEAPPPPKVEPIVSLDLGQVSDPSAMALIDRFKEPKKEPTYQGTYLHRWPIGTPYPRIVEQVVKVLQGDPFKGKAMPLLAIDATGVGRPIADMFKEAIRAAKVEAYFMPVVITGGHRANKEDHTYYVPKRLLVSTVQVTIQTGRLKIASQLPEAATLVNEMQNFQLTFTEAANDTYEGRKGAHDDLLLAVAVGLWAVEYHQRFRLAWA